MDAPSKPACHLPRAIGAHGHTLWSCAWPSLLPPPRILHLALSIAAILAAAPAWAQTSPEDAEQKQEGVVDLDELQVEGTRQLEATGELRDIQGYYDVYTRNLSTVYIGKEMVERFKGAAPADVLKGLLNVHSGDARNSNAIDPNIRGIQGPGRVPVTIDGTEQALTVWRGYNGVNNRNYIDPNLIGGIQVFKGPNLERDVLTSVGGAVAVRTLDADDILRAGQNFGMELRVEGSNNAITPRLPVLLTGMHINDVRAKYPGWNIYNDTSLRINPRTDSSNHLLTVKDDHAVRAAVAGRLGDVTLMAAYAWRDRGNYFAGTHGAGYYSGDAPPKQNYEMVRRLAHSYRPGDEVPNTSSEMESWLLKATWKPTARQQLQFGYRTTLSHYGEIMPSRLNYNQAHETGVPQWPLSRFDMSAYNLSYRWVAETPWIDFHANLWRTDTVSDAYNSGGFPNYFTNADPVIRNTAAINTLNDRNGITLSNRMQLHSTLSLTVGGNFQHEKLGSSDGNNLTTGDEIDRRRGRREEYDLNFNFEWQPMERLTLNAGARYSSFWSFDDGLAMRADANPNMIFYKTFGRTVAYSTWEIFSEETIRAFYPKHSEALIQYFLTIYATEIAEGRPFPYAIPHHVEWWADANGRYRRADNPCTNGMIDRDNPKLNTGQKSSLGNQYRWCNPRDGPNAYGGGPRAEGFSEKIYLTPAHIQKLRGHGWAPAYSAAWQLGDNARLYARHSQAIRYPSMFESTMGFSSGVENIYFWGIKPEHTYNNEIAYVHDFSRLLSANGYANIKLAYFHHRTKNVIDRDRQFRLWNMERQTIRGVEFQGRFDNGRFFTDLGLTRNLENEVCDEHAAVELDIQDETVPDCVKGGHINGYLLTMVIPGFSANALVGGRFFNRRLEAGLRITHHQRHRNIDWENYVKNMGLSLGVNNFVPYNNTPMEWGNVTIFDTYANWRFSDKFSAELTGTNLGNLYYVDPITRTAHPAPGRTLKISFIYQF